MRNDFYKNSKANSDSTTNNFSFSSTNLKLDNIKSDVGDTTINTINITKYTKLPFLKGHSNIAKYKQEKEEKKDDKNEQNYIYYSTKNNNLKMHS